MVATHEEILNYHLFYEVKMLGETYKRLTSGVGNNQALVNAYIESFCLHARNLIEFFEAERPTKRSAQYKATAEPHDASAYMFTEPCYTPMQPTASSKALWIKLNNQIAHLTFNRTAIEAELINDTDRAALLTIIAAEVASSKQRYPPNINPDPTLHCRKRLHRGFPLRHRISFRLLDPSSGNELATKLNESC
jgi:hypothetical protein